MAKDHSAREETRLHNYISFFPNSQQEIFYMHHPIDRITDITAIFTPVAEHWLKPEKDI